MAYGEELVGLTDMGLPPSSEAAAGLVRSYPLECDLSRRLLCTNLCKVARELGP